MLIPTSADPDTGGFFRAVDNGTLAVLRCSSCAVWLHLPRPRCERCGSWETQWDAVPARGTLFSFTRTEHRVDPDFEPPYAVVLVSLDACPDVRLVGHMPGRPELHIGMPMYGHTFKVSADRGSVVWSTTSLAASGS